MHCPYFFFVYKNESFLEISLPKRRHLGRYRPVLASILCIRVWVVTHRNPKLVNRREGEVCIAFSSSLVRKLCFMLGLRAIYVVFITFISDQLGCSALVSNRSNVRRYIGTKTGSRFSMKPSNSSHFRRKLERGIAELALITYEGRSFC